MNCIIYDAYNARLAPNGGGGWGCLRTSESKWRTGCLLIEVYELCD